MAKPMKKSRTVWVAGAAAALSAAVISLGDSGIMPAALVDNVTEILMGLNSMALIFLRASSDS